MASFRTTITVRFGDEDRAGVVYFPRYFDFFHRAFEDFFRNAGRPFREVIEQDGIGWPVVRAEADFKSSVSVGDDLRLELSLEKLGRRSSTFRYDGWRESDGGLVVRGATTVVCVDVTSFEPRDIPPAYRQMFETLRPVEEA